MAASSDTYAIQDGQSQESQQPVSTQGKPINAFKDFETNRQHHQTFEPQGFKQGFEDQDEHSVALNSSFELAIIQQQQQEEGKTSEFHSSYHNVNKEQNLHVLNRFKTQNHFKTTAVPKKKIVQFSEAASSKRYDEGNEERKTQ